MLFALEFGLDISFPMTYGYDSSDPYMRYFMNFYLKNAGTNKIDLITNYFKRDSKKEPLQFISFDNAHYINNNYTKEEKRLYQRMVDILVEYNKNNEDNKQRTR